MEFALVTYSKLKLINNYETIYFITIHRDVLSLLVREKRD